MENRTFIPGSEWVYFKIYTGTKTADAILKNEMQNFVYEMQKSGIIDSWFFIRYSDPDFHIRLRLHLNDTRDFNSVFKCFFEAFQPIVDAGLAWNIQCDTYNRELERYGHNSISLVENLFFIDSEFIIKLLRQLNNENSEQQRWKLALILIDSLLTAFSFDLSQRKELLNTMSENFKKEFGFTQQPANKQLNDKFRNFRKEIESTMLWENEVSEIINIVKNHRQAISLTAEKLIAMEKSGKLEIPLNILLTSIIHMTMNRWFRSKNRLHELVIYDFLGRYYTSEMAKQKYNKQ